MTATIYTPTNLPKFHPGTSGHAKPIPMTRVACVVPEGVNKILAPWEYQTVVPGHWHMVIEAKMDPSKVTYWPTGMSQDTPRADQYGNDEVLDTCMPVRLIPESENNPLAKVLFDAYYFVPNLQVFEVNKTVPVVVFGQVQEDIQFKTAESGTGSAANVPKDSYILRSALRDDRFYFNTPKKFRQIYGGQVLPGPVPEEIIQTVKQAWANFGLAAGA